MSTTTDPQTSPKWRGDISLIPSTEPPNIRITSQWVGPQWAQELLQLTEQAGFRNRRLKPLNVARISHDLLNGRYTFTGESIILDQHGLLLDGRHRLQACVDTGIPLGWCVVVRDVDREAFKFMDTGSKRTTSDQLGILGSKNQATEASLAAFVVRYMEATSKSIDPYINLHTDLPQRGLIAPWEAIEKWEGQREEMVLCARKGSSLTKKVPATALALSFTYWLQRRMSKAAAAQFFEHLMDGAGLEQNHPIYALRERLFSNRMRPKGQQGLDSESMIYLIMRAWDAWVDQEPLSQLRIPKSGRLMVRSVTDFS